MSEMKKIFITMRMALEPEYAEKRDALDVRWTRLLHKAGYIPIFLPNNTEVAERIIQSSEGQGLVLTGGNTLASLGGDAPERDCVEHLAVTEMLKQNLPILGICRGMQFLHDYFKDSLFAVVGHVGVNHPLSTENNGKLSHYIESLEVVNSYHNYAASHTQEFLCLARALDNSIEAIEHKKLPIYGLMWHPERDEIQVSLHLQMLRTIFC